MLASRIAVVLRQNGWALNLIFIALGAYFVAGAMNAVLARSIRVVPTVEDAPSASHAHASLASAHDLTRIADRNLFGIKRENLSPVLATPAADTTLVSGNFSEDQLRNCTMSANLRATLVAEGAPEWSMAVLIVNNEPTVFTVNEGRNQIADDAVLVDVRPRAVVVRRRDHFELCNADENAPGPQSMSPAPQAPVSDDAPPAGDMAGVTKVSDTQYNLERGEVDKALGNLSEVATQARIVPSFKGGKANGFKLFSIKPGSIYSKIGLQNGDVIQKINGYEINSPDKALEIYNKLKNESSVQLDIQRRGQPMSFNYAIGG
jgi:general secretion pathway protein C